MKIVTVDEMQRIEAESDAAGHSYAAMMEQAGRSVAQAITARRKVEGASILILVGPGNNGGDGLVAARYLSEAGAHVTCYLLKPRDPGADENFRLIQAGKIPIVLAEEDEGWHDLQRHAREADILVDALLGTGTRLPLRGRLGDLLAQVGDVLAARQQSQHATLTSLTSPIPARRDHPLIVAVDGPTGLDYSSGALDEAALRADLTVTFAYPKVGHFRFPGAGILGELIVADIGIDPAIASNIALEAVTSAMVQEWLPSRPANAHKGTFGKAMIVAGSVNYTGAAYLSGAAATRSGAGLVTLALPAAIHPAITARLAEATYLLLPHELGVIATGAAQVLVESLEDYDALLIGPGLGRERETMGFVQALLGGTEGRSSVGFGSAEEDHKIIRPNLPPLVLDADGLNILAEMKDWSEQLPSGSILTPHPGEMARLMNSAIDEVQADRTATAQSQAAAWDQVIVLKGAHTVVAAPDGRTVIEPFANPGLATAGTGDVLAGIIVALRAQGVEAFEAAAAGAYLHGLAGELAREDMGAAAMVAGDVLAHLPQALQRSTQ